MIPAIILILACVFYRLAAAWYGGSEWMNFSPMAAITLCGAVFLPGLARWALPAVAMLLSDLVLSRFYHTSIFSWEMALRYFALGAVAVMAIAFANKLRKLPALFGATIAAACWFYLLTNTASWLAETGYAKSFYGWFQALTVGLPGYAPTWQFFTHSLGSDLLFTGVFVVAMRISGVSFRTASCREKALQDSFSSAQ